MKNKKLLPCEVVPLKIRLGVYKEALDIIKKGDMKYGLGSFSLCLLLPSILWNLSSFLYKSPSGKRWLSDETNIMFPELDTFLTKGSNGKYSNKERIEFLERIVVKLTNKPL
jgi:hypothetical protein